MVTTPAMVLSFPEKSTSCRQHRGAQGECTLQDGTPATCPSHPYQVWGMLRVFWEGVWAVPHGRQPMSLPVIYLSFRAQGGKGPATTGPAGQRTCGGIPRDRGTCQAPQHQTPTHLHLVSPGKERCQQTHLHHHPGEDHRHHWVPTGRCLLGQRQRPACGQRGEIGLGHPSGHQKAWPPVRSPVPTITPKTGRGITCDRAGPQQGPAEVGSGRCQHTAGTHRRGHPGPGRRGCAMPQ